MANHVVWHGKKRATLLRREGELLRILQVGGPADALLRAAGDLRDAKVRFLKSEHSRLDLGNGTLPDRLAKLEAEIRAWSSKDIGVILEEYRERSGRTPAVGS